MKKQSIVSLLTLVGGVFLSACGDDVTKVTNVTNETSGIEVVASADSLGACDSSTLGKTVYASDENTAYVCADSGWVALSKNSEGKTGTSCSVETLSDSSGYKIVCGDDSVGVVVNGKNGSNGTDGEKGDAGENGTACTVESLSNENGYKVVCGGDSVGVILNGLDGNGCTLEDNGDGIVTQVCCADTVRLYKALCGGVAYDPKKKFCLEAVAYDLCQGETYDPAEVFCVEDEIYDLCGGEVYDPSTEFCDARDTTFYRYVVIGEQSWMAENLNFDYSEESAKSYCYNDSALYCETYGRFYTWAAAMEACPEGWHLPSDDEWTTLETYIANSLFADKTDSVGYALKSRSNWNDDGNGSDAFGFGALPAGESDGFGEFYLVHEYADFWSSTEIGENLAYFRGLRKSRTDLYSSVRNKYYAFSVRCVKD